VRARRAIESRAAGAAHPSQAAAGRRGASGSWRKAAAVGGRPRWKRHVGREPGEAQDQVKMRRGKILLARDVVRRELRVLDEPPLDLLRAGEHAKKARIWRGRAVGAVDEEADAASDPREACGRSQNDCIVRCGLRCIEGNRIAWIGKQLGQGAARNLNGGVNRVGVRR
jgi:hypothetical protein